LNDRAVRFALTELDSTQKQVHRDFLRELVQERRLTGTNHAGCGPAPDIKDGDPIRFPVIFSRGEYIGGFGELRACTIFDKMAPTSTIHMRIPEPTSKSPFVGLPFQQLTVLLYLNYKHKSINCTPIPAALLDADGNIRSDIQRRDTAGNPHMEWGEVSIKWHQKSPGDKGRLEVPKDYWSAVKACVRKGTRFITMPIGFSCPAGGHANMMIYDKETKELERFEPNATMAGHDGDCFDPPGLDDMIKDLFNKNVKVGMVKTAIPPLGYCPEGFQVIQSYEGEKLETDPGGWCAVWSAWYAETRLLNPNKTREQVVRLAMNHLEHSPESLTRFIRNYSMFISNAAAMLRKSANPSKVFLQLLRGEKFI
jgi:hypothetical protein